LAELDVGQKVAYFELELPDQLDYPWSLSGQLELGPVMFIFYRGDWEAWGGAGKKRTRSWSA
jgi:peroxiredoxin